MSETIDGVAYRRWAYLLGFMRKVEVDAVISQNPVRLPAGQTTTAAYAGATAARAGLPMLQPGTAEPIPNELGPLADNVRSREVYKREYEAKGDYTFVSVPIASLLTPQFEADLEYVDELAERLTETPSAEGDFNFAFPTGEIGEPIIRANTIMFTSRTPSIAITPVPTLRRTQEGWEIVVEARNRPNFLMVARVNGRLILHNGVHKVLALRKRGRDRAFAVLHDAQTVAQLGLPQANFAMFSDQNYVNAARPPLVEDFTRAVAVPVLMRATLRAYQVGISVGDIIAPALPDLVAERPDTLDVAVPAPEGPPPGNSSASKPA